MKRMLAVALLACASGACAFAAGAAETIVVKFSHVVPNDTPKGKGALKFKELAEARTQGRVKVEVYPNSSLYKDKEELEAMQLGAVQMLAPSVTKFGPLGVRSYDLFELPYIFDSYQDLRKVADGPIGQRLLKQLEPKGIIGLAYWDNGFKGLSANRPLRRPEDCKGLKFRIASSKVIDAQMRMLGAIPQVLAFAEMYQALQTGVVDGAENTPSNFYTQKLHEVQKYFTLTEQSVTEYVVIANKAFWDGLPADVRGQLESAMKDATRYVNEIARQENEESLEAIKKTGKTQIIALSADEKRAWKKALLKLHTENEDKIGKALINDVYKETGFDPGKL